jgi:HAD superfamily hydrolase (TIGR01509 family)
MLAVVFDMDGVLVDSEPLWHEAEIAAFAEVGLRLTPADCLRTTGLRVDAVVEYWRVFGRVPADFSGVAAAIVDTMERLLRTCPPKVGAVEAVADVRRRGLRVAIASSSARRLIDAVVDNLGITLDAVCSAELEPHGKPHPGVYLSAARALGVEPAACLAVEDSANGIRSALAAGMEVVAVPDQPVAAEVLAGLAVLGSLLELPAVLDARVRRGEAG